jgi:hypothetical protein
LGQLGRVGEKIKEKGRGSWAEPRGEREREKDALKCI